MTEAYYKLDQTKRNLLTHVTRKEEKEKNKKKKTHQGIVESNFRHNLIQVGTHSQKFSVLIFVFHSADFILLQLSPSWTLGFQVYYKPGASFAIVTTKVQRLTLIDVAGPHTPCLNQFCSLRGWIYSVEIQRDQLQLNHSNWDLKRKGVPNPN